VDTLIRTYDRRFGLGDTDHACGQEMWRDLLHQSDGLSEGSKYTSLEIVYYARVLDTLVCAGSK
jgi:hypothetical protein